MTPLALTRQTFLGKVMSLLFNILSSLVIAFLPRSKHLLISWLQSPSAVILLSLQLCPTLCHPIDGSPGSPVPGILQANTGVGCHFLLQCVKVKSEK